MTLFLADSQEKCINLRLEEWLGHMGELPKMAQKTRF